MIGINRRLTELKQYGVQIQSFNFSQTDASSFIAQAEKVLEVNPAGIVLAPFFNKESLVFIEKLNQLKIPFVFIDSEIKDAGQISYIGQDSFQSGMVSGNLLDLIQHDGNILVIHFAKEMDNLNHLTQREKGFYNWFSKQKNTNHKLLTMEVSDTETEPWMEKVKAKIEQNNIKGIFVTNSKVFFVGRLIEKYGFDDMHVIGHDLLKENVEFLKKGIVQFLICQRPEEQGYSAINKLFRNVIQKRDIAKENYTSIDIVTRENVDYYKEFK